MEIDQQALIEYGRGRSLDFDRMETLVSIMRRQARTLPDKTFIVYKDHSFTYKELDELTDRLAAYLVRIGIQHEEAVGVMIERSELMFIYSMAVMKAGGSYMPLDSHFPEDRLMFMCEDADVKTILSDDGLVQNIMPSFTGTIFESSQIASLPSADDVTFPEVKASDRMVILFTSGSTGKPKGVELEQHGLVNFSHWYVKEYELSPDDNVSAYANYGFDAHMIDMYPTMLAGATLYIIPEEIRLDLMAMCEFIDRNSITVSFFTTVIGAQMSQMFDMKSLRMLGMGGEKMPPVESKPYRLINMYGPTECSIAATRYEVKSHFEGEYIGTALDNVQLYIIDKDKNLVPEGESGELLIAGTGVARGYLNRPELTAEKFIEFNEERAYRSGDLVRWATDPRDGSKQIEFLGRIDGQVKLRGLRIELGEIENRVAAYPAVQQVCVDVKEIGGQQNLVCYYTEKSEVNTDELKAFISETLTAFMVPEVYVKLDAMPLTPNGKVNRKALPVPEMVAGETEIVAPATETEQTLFDITSQILKHDQFGVTTNLLTVGLTSLTAMRLSAMVKMQTGMSLPSGMIMKTPTLRELAYLLMGGRDQATEEQIARVHDKQEYYPLTENQRGLYIDWEMNHEGLQYNLPDVKVIKGHTADELLAAMQKVVAAHPILKMRLANVEGEVVQHRRDDAELPIVCKQLTEVPTAEFFQSRVRPFDLFNDDLCRIEIYSLPSREGWGGSLFLFTDIHHIIYDGGSTFAFEGDTVKALNGEPLTTESYTAYDRALDEQEMHQMPMYEKAETYFDTLMSEGYEIAAYPHSAKPENTSVGTLHAVATMDSQAVKDYCKANSVTESTFFMTVVGQTLHRLLREDNLLFTSITNGRMTPEMHNIIGMFVQTLPVISHVAKGTVIEAMRKQQEQYIQTQENSIMPYTKVVEKYGVKSEIMFAFQGGAGTLLEKNEEDAQYAVTTDTAMFPLAIQVIPVGNKYNIDIEFDTHLYNKRDIDQLAHAICSLAKNVTDGIDTSFKNLALVSKEEAEAIIAKSYGGDLAYNTEETLVDKVIRHAQERPDAVAVVDHKCKYTYQELESVSNVIARKLIAEDVQPNEFVCIMLPRCKEFVASVLGVMKAGAAYVPVDMEYPEDRRQYMIEDSEAKVVITEEWLANNENETLRYEDENCGVNLAKPSGRAYMIYTSGSTGKPKGVVIHHNAITACAAWLLPEFGLKPGKKNMHHPSFSFDASTFDLFYPLMAGAEIHILDENQRKDMDFMAVYIKENGITGMTMSTALGMALLNQYDLDIEYIMLGGEKFLPVKKSNTRLYNGYGPTEFTVCSSFHIIDQDKDVDIPIGRAVLNTYSFICDSFGNLLPQGEMGELCLAGPQIAECYWHREDLTAEKFCAIPFAGSNPSLNRMYRTGDLARYNADGELEFCGRIDNQVKLRGFRIEMGEIENAAKVFAGIMDVAAEVRKINGQDMLCLYYTAATGIDKDALKSSMSETLTDYMVPNVFVQMDTMPLTPNGKVNRKALPVPETAAEAIEIVAPETNTEKQLFDIAVQILKHDQFGVTTNLLTVGLTSLTAMRLSAMIQQQMGVSVSTKSIMLKPTIREMAESLNATSAPVTVAKVHAVQEYYPLTDNQRGVYVDWELNRDTTQYNIPFARKMEGCTAEQLVTALTKVVDAHPILKARLATVDGETMLQRRDNHQLGISVCQLQEKPDVAFFQSKVRPFDLFNDDLCRLEVYTFGDEVYMFADIHHIVYDGGSSIVFMEDLKRALAGDELTSESYTAFDNALDEQERMASPAFAEAEKYVDSMMSEYEVASYPHSAHPDTQESGASQLSVNVKGEAITMFCQEHGVTLNSFFMAMTTQALHRLLRLDKLLITSITSGRDKAELQDIIGMFVQTLPVVTAISKTSVIDTVKDVQRQYIETQGNSLFGYTRIAEKYGAHADIMFAYQGGAGAEEIMHNDMELKLNKAKAPITIIILPQDDDYNVIIEYESSLYALADIMALGKVIACMSEHAAKDANALITTLPLVDENEAAGIIAKSYGGDLAYNTEETLVDKVIRYAQTQPDSVAVVDHKSRYTYKELDSVSNAIAQRLISEGVQPNEFVCIMLPRVKEFVAAVIGVMKAGAAYVPVDMEYPEDRRQYMQEDSEAKILITQEWLSNIDGSPCDNVNLASPSGRAYMIYTSGTTGKPKGAVILHRNLNAFLAWNNDRMHQSPETRHLVHASFSFDASIFDMLCALSAGGQVHIIEEDLRRDLDGMAKYITDNRITGMLVTTQVGMALLNTYDLPLEYILLGGEKMLPVRKTNIRVINAYGPTEFTAASTYYDVQGDEEDIPIGRPVPNSYGLVVDSFGNLLPWGMAGELCMAGVQAGEGYWHRPELTAEKFFKIQLTGETVDAYHTGDLVRYNEQGDIIYCGRIDNQVKLRGFRIEMGEIESRAAAYDGVKQAAAEVKKVNGQDILCLYYTCKGNATVNADELKAHLSASLTAYMIPDTFTQLDEFPMTPGGKVNRKALPVPEIEVAALENVAPATTRESTLLGIAHELLGRADFGVTDGLKELGMTSLTAIKLAAKAKQEGILLKAGDIMHHNTVRKISQAMMTVASWFEPYDPAKPIIVLVSGIITRDMNQPRMEYWSKQYNILFIEPVDEHYNYLFTGGEGYDDVAAFYYDLVDTYAIMNPKIQTDIVAFGGFCLGGFIGYSLALLHRQATGKRSKVFLGDSASSYVGAIPMTTDADYEESYNNTIGILEMAMRQTKREGQNEEAFMDEVSGLTRLMVTKFDIGTRVAAGASIPENDLEAILFNTYVGRDINDFPEMWKLVTPHLKTINLPTDHFSFCLNMGNVWTENFCDAVTEFLQ